MGPWKKTPRSPHNLFLEKSWVFCDWEPITKTRVLFFFHFFLMNKKQTKPGRNSLFGYLQFKNFFAFFFLQHLSNEKYLGWLLFYIGDEILPSYIGCFLKWWYPQIIHFNRVFHYKPSILEIPRIFGNTHLGIIINHYKDPY